MNWLSNLLRGSAAKPSPQPSPRRPAPSPPRPAADIEALRGALAAAAGDDERAHRAEELGRELAMSLKAPLPEDPPGVRVAAVCHAPDKTIALEWLAVLDESRWLAEVATHARFAEVRLAAAQRIEDGDVLERVARDARAKDKGVYRHCADVLRQRREAAERLQRAAGLAAAFRSLLDHAPLSVSHLLELEHQLRALGEGGEATAECHALLEQANQRILQEADARRELRTVQADAAALSAECSGAQPAGTEAFERWRERLLALTQTHAAVPAWLAAEAAGRALEASLLAIEAQLQVLEADAARIEVCEQFLDSLSGAPIGAEAHLAWGAMPKPDQAAARERLQARWLSLQPPPAAPAPRAPARTPPPAPARPQIDLVAVRRLLESLEGALDEGHLAEADAAAKQIKAAIGAEAPHGELGSRLQRAQARLSELGGWARWGATNKRAELIAAAEELLTGEHDVEHLATVVPALREEWKRLGTQALPAKGQWERFDAALEKAYQPVAARNAEEAARRAQVRAEKEALCSDWEAEVAAVAWPHADYAVIDTRRQQMLKQWRAAPRAGFRDERALRKRFDALIASIDQRVAAARGTEVERREQLIAAVEALRELPDLRTALAEAKSLQERWKNEAGPLRLPPGEEQKMWQRFRASCDAVFARRDAQRAEHAAQREKSSQARAAALEALETALAGTDTGEIKRALAQFRTDWGALKPAAGESADVSERRARDLQQQAQRRIDALRQDAYRARLERLAQQAAPIEGVDAEALAAGSRLREELLIDLEIALDLQSPSAAAEARRKRQLEQLRNRFRSGSAERPPAEELLARWHATAAHPDAAQDQRIAAVVQKLVEQHSAAEK